MTIARQYVQHNGISVPVIEGAKGKGGGGKIAPNSLFSSDILFLTTALGEGPLYRINPNGPQDIQIQDSSIEDLINMSTTGDVNTKNFIVASTTGTVTQAPLPIFGQAILTPQAFASPVSLKYGPPIGVLDGNGNPIYKVEDADLYSPKSSVTRQQTSAFSWDALRFIFTVNQLARTDSDGNVKPYSAKMGIQIYNSAGSLIPVGAVDSLHAGPGSRHQYTTYVDFEGKTDKPYRHSVEVRIDPEYQDGKGYFFDVFKSSLDDKDSRKVAAIDLTGWVEIEYKRQAYPRTAIIGYGIKAANEHTGGIPTFTSMIKGLIVKVPSNYNQPVLSSSKIHTYGNNDTNIDVYSNRAGEIDWRELELPETGTYGYTVNGYTLQRPGPGDANKKTAANPQIYVGTWDGSFVYSWTQNPVWIIYDILTNSTYGLGIPEENIDKYKFYQVAQYCDACDPKTGKFIGVDGLADGSYRYKPRGLFSLSHRRTLTGVPEGTPIKERRFITDLSIVDQEKSMDLLNKIAATFRAVIIYSGSKITLAIDMPGEYPVMQFNEATIKQGTFSISGNKESDVITGIDVSYIDPTNHFKRETVRIDTADSNTGDQTVDIENIATVDLAGVTRRSQAVRFAQYQIAASRYQRRAVSFTTSTDAINLSPGDIISIASRASGVAYGYGGKIAFSSDRNLIGYSEDFSNGGWGKTRCTITTNTATAPDGTLTADTVTASASDPYIEYPVSSKSLTHTVSVWVQGTASSIGGVPALFITRDSYAEVKYSGLLEPLTSSWQRYTFTATFNTVPTTVSFRLDFLDGTVVAGDNAYIWGAQLEVGSVSTPYVKTPGITSVTLEHYTVPPLTSTVFTQNTYPLSLRILNQVSDRLETYIISNTSFSTSNVYTVNSSIDIATVTALSRYNKTSKTYQDISSIGFTANVMPKAGDLWSLGEIQNPLNYYSNQADKLFKVTNLKRENGSAEIEVNAIEYISDVYIDSDTFINYEPTSYTDIPSAFSTPATPEFTLTAIPRTKLDGTVVVDGKISTNTRKDTFGPKLETEYYLATPSDVSLVANVTARSPLTLLASNASTLYNQIQAVLAGKNGFTSTIGTIKLLCNAVSTATQGSIVFTIEGLSSCIDLNYNQHVLDVLPSSDALNATKAFNKVLVPIIEKQYDPAYPKNFVGYQPTINAVTFDTAAYDTTLNTITIADDFIDGGTFSSKVSNRIPKPPFYVTIKQVLTAGGYSNNSFYLDGTESTFIKSGVLVPGAQNVITLDIKPRDTSFIRFYVDGIARDVTSSVNLNKNLSIDANILFTPLAATYDTTYRLEADYYTVPTIEVGDLVHINEGNVFAVTNSSFDISNAKYNNALTSNSIYRIELEESPSFDVTGYTFTNITQNPVGTINNVSGRSFTFDYDSSIYPGSYKLANSRVYSVELDSIFNRYYLVDDGYIPELASGYTSVKARNKNTIGRYSPYVQKSIYVEGLPIQRVENLILEETIYIEQLAGATVKVTVIFDAIKYQQVTDYEISYKITGARSLSTDDYNTVKVSAAAVDSNGKIRYTISNVDRGLKTEATSITVRVTAINKTIRGATIEKTASIVGKTAKPLNVINITGGQQSDVVMLFWDYERNPLATAQLYDLDLSEVAITRLPGVVSINIDNYVKSEKLVTVAPPTASKTLPIDSYGTYTYFFRTFDTSGNASDTIGGTTITTVRSDRSTVVAAWSEDNPPENFAGIPNNNTNEPYFPSFSNSLTGGTIGVGATVVDKANGSSSGWSVTTPINDLKAVGSATYYTQIRDFGQSVTGTLYVTTNATQVIQSSYNDQHIELQNSVTDTYLPGFTYFNNVSIASKELDSTDVYFSNTGSYMYVLGTTSNANVYQYNLTSAWNVATAIYESNAYIGFRDTAPEGLFFKPDGTKMYFVGATNDRVYEYDLSNAWLSNTATYLQNVSIAAQDTAPSSLTFSNTGTSMYIAGRATNYIYQYTLSTPWNVSTASYTTRADIAPQDTSVSGFTFNTEGTRAYMTGRIGDNVYKYTLSEAWNISTLAYSSNAYIGAREFSPHGLYVNDTESSIYIIGPAQDKVQQYNRSATTTPNVLIDSDYGGIGNYIAKAGYKYDTTNKTWSDGITNGNVYAIWNHGQFVGDTANANSYALIAGYINANAIALGNTYYANGMSTGGNTFANVTNGGASYTLVDLTQYNDVDTLTYAGALGKVSAKLYARTAIDNVYHTNGMVNTSVFSSSGEGWIPYTVGRSTFRYLQLKYEVINNDTANYDFILDKFRYTIDKDQINYSNTFTYTSSPMTIDYSSSKFIKVPTIQASIITTTDGTTNLAIAVFTAISNTSVSLKLARANGSGFYPADGTATVMLSAQGV